jgi:hypothetical protein
MLASIGVGKGRIFKPDTERAALLADAVRQGQAYMQDYFVNQALKSHWPDRQWLATQPRQYCGVTFLGDGQLAHDHRAGGFAFWTQRPPGDPTKLPADTPAGDFWSVIAYESSTNAFIHNSEYRVGVSSYDKEQMTVNADGAVDVYVGPAAPAGLERNWIPTAGKDFWLVSRFYGPQPPLFDKSWTLDDVQPVV